MTIEEDFVNILQNATGLQIFVNLKQPKNQKCITYQRISTMPSYSTSGIGPFQARFQINILGFNYGELVGIANTIISTMDRKQSTNLLIGILADQSDLPILDDDVEMFAIRQDWILSFK